MQAAQLAHTHRHPMADQHVLDIFQVRHPHCPCGLCRYYLEAFCKDERQSRQLAEALEAAVTAELVQPEAHGLTRPQH